MTTNNKLFSFMSALLLLALMVSWKSIDGVGMKASVNGEQAFRDIVFFEGANMLNDVSEYSRFKRIAEDRGALGGKSFEDFKNFTVALIKKKDPDYFTSFGNVIQRSNPYEIKELLTSSLQLPFIL